MSESQPCIDGRFNAMSRSVSARIGAGSGREQCRFGESVSTKPESGNRQIRTGSIEYLT